MSIVTKVSVQRSWADIVKASTDDAAKYQGHSEDESCIPPQQLEVQASVRRVFKPGQRGTMACLCYGRLLVILGHYGWIEARGTIDHADADKNGGRIHVRWRDIVGDVREGDIVCFYLYADEQGLGAEHCQAAMACDLKKMGSLAEDMQGFARAARRLQHPEAEFDGLNPEAPEFVPCSGRFQTGLVLADVGSYNETYLSDEFSSMMTPETVRCNMSDHVVSSPPTAFSEGISIQTVGGQGPTDLPGRQSYGEKMRARIADYFCDDSDDESSDGESVQAAKCTRSHSSDGSTSAGALSDSDLGDDDEFVMPFRHFRPPPGLSLPPPPACIGPPPGL